MGYAVESSGLVNFPWGKYGFSLWKIGWSQKRLHYYVCKCSLTHAVWYKFLSPIVEILFHFCSAAPDNRKAAVVNKVRIGTNSRPSLPASRRHQGTTSASTTKDYKTLDASRKTHTNYNMEEKVPLIYATTNKNRAGWLMPDESIPEWLLMSITANNQQSINNTYLRDQS